MATPNLSANAKKAAEAARQQAAKDRAKAQADAARKQQAAADKAKRDKATASVLKLTGTKPSTTNPGAITVDKPIVVPPKVTPTPNLKFTPTPMVPNKPNPVVTKTTSAAASGGGGSRPGEINNPQTIHKPQPTPIVTKATGTSPSIVRPATSMASPTAVAPQPSMIPSVPVQTLPGYGAGASLPQNIGGSPASLMGAAAIAKLYGITADRGTIEGIYNDATKAQFELERKRHQQVSNTFVDSIFTGMQANKDTIRKGNAAAVATGASRGMQAAQEMSALLMGTQQNAAGATAVAQEGAMINDKENVAMMQNVVNALTASNAAGTGMAGIDMNKYAADTQLGVGQMDANARNYAAELGLQGTMYGSNKNLEGQLATANSYAKSGGSSYGGNTSSANLQADFQAALSKDPKSAWMVLVQGGVFPDAKSAQAYVDSLTKAPRTVPIGATNDFQEIFGQPYGGYTNPYK